MRMKFIGQYTNGRGTITYLGCTFEGHEPREVPAEVAELLAGHAEFEVTHPLDHDGDGVKGGMKRRGRPRKVQANG